MYRKKILKNLNVLVVLINMRHMHYQYSQWHRNADSLEIIVFSILSGGGWYQLLSPDGYDQLQSLNCFSHSWSTYCDGKTKKVRNQLLYITKQIQSEPKSINSFCSVWLYKNSSLARRQLNSVYIELRTNCSVKMKSYLLTLTAMHSEYLSHDFGRGQFAYDPHKDSCISISNIPI